MTGVVPKPPPMVTAWAIQLQMVAKGRPNACKSPCLMMTMSEDRPFVTTRKVSSPTQPGRGIRKIIDLYHDLPELLDKANRHVVSQRLAPAERAKVDSNDFVGMSKEDIEDERQEYVILQHEVVTVTQRDDHIGSRKRCYRALEKLNKLIPGFEQKATAAEDTNIFCAPVCHSYKLITAI